MKTLKEINQSVSSAIESYKANQETLEANIKSLQSAVIADKQAMNEAASNGNSAAYAKASANRDFHSSKLEHTMKQKTKPIYTDIEAAEIIKDAETRLYADLLPIYKRMKEIREECHGLLAQAEALYASSNAIRNSLHFGANLQSVSLFGERMCPDLKILFIHYNGERALDSAIERAEKAHEQQA